MRRMSDCSGLLQFAWADNIETGETCLKLSKAQFCRVRHCPVCPVEAFPYVASKVLSITAYNRAGAP